MVLRPEAESILLDLVQAEAEAADPDPDGHRGRGRQLVRPVLLQALLHLLLAQPRLNVGVEPLEELLQGHFVGINVSSRHGGVGESAVEGVQLLFPRGGRRSRDCCMSACPPRPILQTHTNTTKIQIKYRDKYKFKNTVT